MELSSLPDVSLPLPWHNQEWSFLTEAIAAGNLPHALLVVGNQHIGKQELALALARKLLCAQGDGAANCGKCHACELSASGSHGDFLWVQPQEKSRVVKIDQVREVVKFSHKTAGFGLRKVIVIAPAESMNVSAFNALLKSLEEPAQDTYLLLVCNRMHGVPATIRSRCQILRVAAPQEQESLKWLDGYTGSPKDSQTVLNIAGGSPLLAKAIYQSGDTEIFAKRSVALRALLAGHISITQAATFWDDVDVSLFLEQCSVQLQGLLRSLSGERLRSSTARSVFQLLDELMQLQKALSAGANPSRQLLIESFLSKVLRELGGDSLGANIPEQLEGARL